METVEAAIVVVVAVVVVALWVVTVVVTVNPEKVTGHAKSK